MGEYTNYIGRRIKMNLNKNLLLVTAIIGIGLFVLPSTLSMFAGQHSWYNPNERGIPCYKCHEMEKYELGAVSGPHSPGYSTLLNSSANYNASGTGNNGSANFWGDGTVGDRCYGCHQIGNNASGETSFADYNDTIHAAIIIECIDCHPWVHTELTNSSAAHKPFYLSNESTLLGNSNTICIACHTHVGVNLSWTRAAYVSFNVSVNSTTGYNVTWNATSLGTNETFVTNTTY